LLFCLAELDCVKIQSGLVLTTQVGVTSPVVFRMDLSRLTHLIDNVPEYQRLRDELSGLQSRIIKLVATDAVRPFVIAALHQELQAPFLVITTQPEGAKRLYEELRALCPDLTSPRYFPETDFLLDEAAPDITTGADRLRTLAALTFCRTDTESEPSPIVISSALAAAGKTIPRDKFQASCHTLQVGMTVEPRQLSVKWHDMGYEFENIVEIPGTMSRRGGIVDVFSPDSELPIRLEFAGNRIESIRFFDPATQRSLKQTTSINIVPAKESHQDKADDTILDYLNEKALLITDDVDELKIVVDKLYSETEEISRTKPEPAKQADLLVLPWSAFEKKLKKTHKHLMLRSWNAGYSDEAAIQLPLSPVPSFGGRLESLSRGLKQLLQQRQRVIVVSQQTSRLAELLQEQDIVASSVSQIEQVPPMQSVTLVHGSLADGWAMKDVLTLFTDKEIFGFVKKRRLSDRHPVRYHLFVPELTPGEFVVHIDHGIARFGGVTRITTEGVEREYLVLEYAAGDRLYVPTDQVDCVSRYIGASDKPPTLSRLGTQEWARTKQRIKESVARIASELLDLYAAREVIPGFAFSSDTLWQQELESSFPYMETPDQLEAVAAVKKDMEKLKPMDRLVCGDVGYGKTEVALRAAFKAVMDGKQVALLVPTTVLAQQHFVTFLERLQAFPVRVEMLSRFRTEKEQAEIISGLLAGSVDICIGTHRLLQKDIVFKDLGLVIIDEEQRFGVAHKEHFKKLRREVDVLTLSATPIPRTLHMSLAGIRDMSTIETPPEERLPIKTYVGTYDDGLIREAVLREIERNGQVFFVHNRVHSISMVADRLSGLVPEARVSVAHGQMPEEELEKVMGEFIGHESDILVTTTIIESGLDIPNANSLIVNQADSLGLTQLYQLRGRVGRGSSKAYAYFLYDRGKQLTPEARKRLKTISEATELGAGFAVAMKDLEIRGAGNLLGVEQSGYIAAVGFDLYSRLLSEAVEELKQGRVLEKEGVVVHPPVPTIDLPIAAFIPEEYVSDLSTRLAFYQRLAAVKRFGEIDDIEQELNDRFGPPLEEVKNLLYVVRIKQLATEATLDSITTEKRLIVLNFNNGRDLNRLPLPSAAKAGIKIGSDRIKLDIKILGNRWQEVLTEVLRELDKRYAKSAA
jgi:transcription-repair coupling factor (superfamily II helicase)